MAIVTLITAGNDYSKEVQFRQLSDLADAGEVSPSQGLAQQNGTPLPLQGLWLTLLSRAMHAVPAAG